MSAVMFFTNRLWMQDFTKNWACKNFIENTAPSKTAPKLTISLQTKVVCYSPSYKNFWHKILWLSKTSLIRRATFESYLNCPYKIVVVWDDQTIGNMDPCCQSNSNITEKASFLHNVTRALVTLRRSQTFTRTTINLGLETPHSLDETARLPGSY